MHTPQSLDANLITIRNMRTPLASLYVPLTPELQGRPPETAISQTRNALDEAGVPAGVASSILQTVRQSGHARTSAIWAREAMLRLADKEGAELHFVDGQAGEALLEARGRRRPAPLAGFAGLRRR